MKSKIFCMCLSVFTLLIASCSGSNEDSSQTVDKQDAKAAFGKSDSSLIEKMCLQIGMPSDCDLCEVMSWYNDGECDDFCPKPDADCSGGNPCEDAFGTCTALTQEGCPLGSVAADWNKYHCGDPDIEGEMCCMPCPAILCELYCSNGFKTDENGCEICVCKEDECNSDSDCPQPKCPCCKVECENFHCSDVIKIDNCCGNQKCEEQETKDNCAADCPEPTDCQLKGGFCVQWQPGGNSCPADTVETGDLCQTKSETCCKPVIW